MKRILLALLLLSSSYSFGQQCSCPEYEKKKKQADELLKTDLQKAKGTYALAGVLLEDCVRSANMSNDSRCKLLLDEKNQNLRQLIAKLDKQDKKPPVDPNKGPPVALSKTIPASVSIKKYSKSLLMPDKGEIMNHIERGLAKPAGGQVRDLPSAGWVSSIEERIYNFNYLDEDKKVYDSTSRIISSKKNADERLLYEYLRSAMFYTWNLLDEKGNPDAIKKANQIIEQQINVVVNNSKLTSPQMLFAYSSFENLLSKYYQDNNDNLNNYKHSLLAMDYGAKAVIIEPGNPYYLRGLFTYLDNMKYCSDSILLRYDKSKFASLACDVADFMRKNTNNKFISISAQVQCIISRTSGLNADKKYHEATSLLKQGISDISNLKAETAYIEYGPIHLALLYNELSGIYNSYDKDSVLYKSYTRKALSNLIQTLSKQIISQRAIDKIGGAYTTISSNIDWTFNTKEKVEAYKSIINAIEKGDNDYLNLKNIAFVYVDANAILSLQLLKKKTAADTLGAMTYVNNAVNIFNKADFLKNYNGYSEDYARFCNIFDGAVELYAAQNNFIMAKNCYDIMTKTLGPIVKKYDFDFYLTQHIVHTLDVYGSLLFQKHRYKEAMPILEQGSFEGIRNSTNKLATIYGNDMWGFKDTARQNFYTKRASCQRDGLERFTVPGYYQGITEQIYVYVLDRAKGHKYKGIEDQAKFFQVSRGVTIPEDVISSFTKLQNIAWENNVSFEDLCIYALGAAQTPETNKTEGGERK